MCVNHKIHNATQQGSSKINTSAPKADKSICRRLLKSIENKCFGLMLLARRAVILLNLVDLGCFDRYKLIDTLIKFRLALCKGFVAYSHDLPSQ